MRKLGALLAALFITVPAMANNVVSKTYFSNHPWFGAASPERVALARARMDVKDQGKGGSLEAVGFYSRTNAEQDLRDFLLPAGGKTSLRAAELGATSRLNLTNDLLANYFNLSSHNVMTTGGFDTLTYESDLAFAPRQTVIGVGFQWQQRVNNFWLKVSVPVTKVENDMRMTETLVTAGNAGAGGGTLPTNAVGSMVDAFKQSAMLYGKIDGKRSKWGVADVEIMLGRDVVDEDNCQISGYVGAVAPTGKKPTAEYLFEAVVGNNKHAGIMFGSYGRHVWKEGDDYVASICYDMDGRYLFENTQKRMLDYKNKPWGRYIWLAKSGATFGNPGAGTDTAAAWGPVFSGSTQDMEFGVNVLTQDVKVKPRGSATVNTALNLRKQCGFELEVGHNLYARQAEEVALANSFANSDSYGVPYINDEFVHLKAVESKFYASTIDNVQGSDAPDQNPPGTPKFRVVAESDLDLNSAAHPSVIENTFYGSLGKNWDNLKCPAFVGLGGSYTYSFDNAGANRWGVWGKAGISF